MEHWILCIEYGCEPRLFVWAVRHLDSFCYSGSWFWSLEFVVNKVVLVEQLQIDLTYYTMSIAGYLQVETIVAPTLVDISCAAVT